MAKRTVGTMATDEVTDGSQLAFTISKDDIEGGIPAIWVTGLAGVEKAYLWMSVGTTPTWEEVEDNDVQATFSVTKKHFILVSEGDFGITKDATAGALTVTLEGV